MFEVNYKKRKSMIKSLQPYLKYEEMKEPELLSILLKKHSCKRNKTKSCSNIDLIVV